ncbi:MAG: FGGY family carbohydrate kinase [Sedimentisphaerales bacterium]|nr:FGGY family carbohydrate kinase [Sedimentisphaerales bacterium]HNY80254.1 FGGY family carbohydrate kinase [Sedimentisphaerales bacterium]HOH66013.1 FGGY family carbohydrate kinase [Sedimentisphaerales bacterium]HPY50019.1 FGGY family carbohydrate kinase [Sedimentisphaerales bacterium]HQA89786.1 FGGY family carbohydrate kinase [Sedimentisphaerales bacterium]
MRDILSIDVGTTAFKMGVFNPGLDLKCSASREYEVRVYDQGKADIDPQKWWEALRSCCRELQPNLAEVGILSLSVTTPGLTAMAEDGNALGPAILFFDQRSQQQARRIRHDVGEEFLLAEACNLPVSGGSSLCSTLWIRDNQPDVWSRTYKFGHTNTYMVKRLTGQWAIDPSTMSITGLYDTRRNQLSWLDRVLEKAGIDPERLPPLMPSHAAAGTLLPEVADELGLPRGAAVLCGGNDAVLAGLSAGLADPGQVVDIAGTCEIAAVCIDRPVGSPNYNIRCHVLPGRWMTFFVLNTGGKALEWFHSVFCRDMSKDEFYEKFVPQTIAGYLAQGTSSEDELPEYVPYLQGSRYSLEPLTAAFSSVTLETDRQQMLLGLLRGNLRYVGSHLKEVSQFIELKQPIITTGGGARIGGMDLLKKRWMAASEYRYQDQSSLLGAAMLGRMYEDGI